jgi:hypothetical protein
MMNNKVNCIIFRIYGFKQVIGLSNSPEQVGGSCLCQRSVDDSSETGKAVMIRQVECMVGGPVCHVVGMPEYVPDF